MYTNPLIDAKRFLISKISPVFSPGCGRPGFAAGVEKRYTDTVRIRIREKVDTAHKRAGLASQPE